MKQVLAALVVVGLLMPLTASGEIDFNKFSSINKWLETGTKRPSTVYASDSHEFGSAIALHQILNDQKDKWVAVEYANYRWGVSYPISRQRVQFSQRPSTWKNIVVGAYAYIHKKDDPSKKLVVRIFSTSTTVYYNFNKPGAIDTAKEFLALVEKQSTKGSVYGGGILEYKKSGFVGFLDGVDSFKHSWDSLILEASLKKRVRKKIESFLKDYDYKKWKKWGLPMNRGLLFEGPPGTGKSFLGKVLISRIFANDYNRPVTYIHVGARHAVKRKAISDIYAMARLHSPSVVFIEDIDLIAGTNRNHRADIKNELMQQLSGIENLNGVMTIGTTNLGKMIDPALTRKKRLGYQFHFGLPSPEQRADLFRLFTRDTLAGGLKITDYVNRTEGQTGADIKEICETGIERAIRLGSIDGPKNKVILQDEHIQFAIQRINETKLDDDSEVQG